MLSPYSKSILINYICGIYYVFFVWTLSDKFAILPI